MSCIVDCKHGSLERSMADSEFWVVTDPWARRARSALDREKHFAALIYSWISFNAWVGRVVADPDMSNQDRYLVASAALDEKLAERFRSGGLTNAVSRTIVMAFRHLNQLPNYDPPGGRTRAPFKRPFHISRSERHTRRKVPRREMQCPSARPLPFR